MLGLSAAAAAATSVAKWWSGVEQDDHDLHEHDPLGYHHEHDHPNSVMEMFIAWWNGPEPSDGEEELPLDSYSRS
jgi:hypothetical protein